MTLFAQHPESHVKIALDDLRPWETNAPKLLQEFLQAINLTKSTEDVWDLYVDLCHTLGQTTVTYGYLRYVSHNETDVVLRTNLPDEWAAISNAIPNFSYFDYGRMHIFSKVTSFYHGIEFLDLYEGQDFYTPEYRAIVEKAAEFGMRSAMFIPFRSSIREEKGGSAFLGPMPRAEFEALVAEHGWTMQVAALYVHNFYQMHLKQHEAESLGLADRQIDILRLSANGYAIKEIAAQWGVTDRAIAKHIRTICTRFGTQSKMAVMAKAIRLGLIFEADFETDKYMSTDWV